MIEQEILSLKDFYAKLHKAFHNIVTELYKTNSTGREYGGAFYVMLLNEEEENETFNIHTWDELNEAFKKWCEEFTKEYNDIYLQKATLINPALTYQVEPDKATGVILTLPYIKFMRIIPRYKKQSRLCIDDFDYN